MSCKSDNGRSPISIGEVQISSPYHSSHFLGMRAGLFNSLTVADSDIESVSKTFKHAFQIHISKLLAICILYYSCIIVVWSIVNLDTNFYANFVFCVEPSGYCWEYDSVSNKVIMKQVSGDGKR